MFVLGLVLAARERYNGTMTEQPIVDIDSRLIDGKVFIDMDALAAFMRNEYDWARRTADAMQDSDIANHADGMQQLVELVEFNAMKLREDLS